MPSGEDSALDEARCQSAGDYGIPEVETYCYAGQSAYSTDQLPTQPRRYQRCDQAGSTLTRHKTCYS